jgi:anti-sigma factor RsiW
MTPSELEDDASRHLGPTLMSYCFGGLSEAEQDAVEQHLMVCDSCWRQFQRLDVAVRALRSSPEVVPTLSAADAVAVFGISRELGRPLGGHAVFVSAIVILFGLEWTVGLWSELGYSYDRFGALAWTLSAPVGLWAGATLLLGLWTDARATRAGKTSGLLWSIFVNLLGLGALVAALVMILPAERTIQASFQTRTAAGGYLKDAEFIFAPLLVFILPTFHTVACLQRELAAGRFQQVLAVFGPRSERVLPRGMLYVPIWVLTTFLLVESVLKITGTNHMLDALTPGPYAQLFSNAAYISTAIWFAIAIAGLWWYCSALNELKREARAIVSLERRRSS